jgi:hypothetical protein
MFEIPDAAFIENDLANRKAPGIASSGAGGSGYFTGGGGFGFSRTGQRYKNQ